MSGYEQSKTEAGRRKVTVPKRKTVAQDYFNRIESAASQKRKAKETIEKIGNAKYIDEGVLARILDINILDINKLTTSELTSYNFGYYTTANSLMVLLSMGIVPDRLIKIAKIRRITIEDSLSPEELLQAIGKRDSKDENIDIANIPSKVQTNEFYLKGYTSGKTK